MGPKGYVGISVNVLKFTNLNQFQIDFKSISAEDWMFVCLNILKQFVSVFTAIKIHF